MEGDDKPADNLDESLKAPVLLQEIATIVERPGITLNEILQGTINLLPSAWQYPEVACALAIVDGKEFKTSNWRDPERTQSACTMVNGIEVGKLMVGYLEERPVSDEGPFLKAERLLLDVVAERIGRVIERMRTRDQLMASEARYRRLFESAQDAILILDGDTGKIVDANPFIRELLGYSMDELAGKSLWEIGTLRDTLASKLSSRQLKESGYVRYENLPLVASDGREIAVEVVANSYLVDHQKVIQCNIRDVTERKRSEDAIRSSEDRFRTLTEHSIAGIFVFQEGKIVFVNSSFSRITGYSPEEVIGKLNPMDMIHPDDRQAAMKTLLERLDGHQGNGFNLYRGLRKDGTTPYVEVYGAGIAYRGKPAVMGTVLDVTERKQLEEERQKGAKLESIGVLAGGIAHDFNNLLTSILGNIQLAEGYLKQDRVAAAQEMLSEAEKATFQAKELTQQLLTFSRGGAPVKRIIGIKQLLEESATFALRGSRVKPEFEIPADLWAVDADAGQIRQVINNIVLNADQAMPNGGVIVISARNLVAGKQSPSPLPEGSYVEINIKDHGTGIPRNLYDKIFDPYFTTKQKGSGLGLASVYSIIRNHSGLVTFESEVGVGTTFHIHLPATTVKIEEVDRTVSPIAQPMPSTHGRILIMDDEGSIRLLLSRMLKGVGYEVELAEDGGEAVRKFAQAKESGLPYDAVILDLTIPGGTGGREVIKELLQIDPGVRAIVSSGYADDPVMAEYKKFGFSGVVTKPYHLGQMQETLRSILDYK